MRERRTKRPTASFSGLSTSSDVPARALQLDERPAPLEKADYVLVLKAPRRMLLLRGRQVLRDYEVSLGKNPAGPKRHHMDGRTPEGRYFIDGRNEGSRFHRSLHISYPNEQDREFARHAGIAPGDGVMIHGLPDGERWVGDKHREYDWTNGCIGVTDDEMDEIWRLVDDGTPIEIRP
jgi:murein L,D-transpeptidase YafK